MKKRENIKKLSEQLENLQNEILNLYRKEILDEQLESNLNAPIYISKKDFPKQKVKKRNLNR